MHYIYVILYNLNIYDKLIYNYYIPPYTLSDSININIPKIKFAQLPPSSLCALCIVMTLINKYSYNITELYNININ